MKWHLNLNIPKKLVLGFLLITLFSGAMGIYAIHNLKNITNSGSEFYHGITIPIEEIGTISTEIERIRVNTGNMILAQTPEDIQANIDKLMDNRRIIDQMSTSFEETILTDDIRKAFDEYKAKSASFKADTDKVIELAQQNKDTEAMAMVAENGEFGKTTKAYQDAIDKIVLMKINDATAGEELNKQISNRTITVIIAVIIFEVLLSILIGVFVSTTITRPLKKAVSMLNKMSKGYMQERLNMDSQDEIGQMARALDCFADQIQKKVAGILNRISAGDVSMEIAATDERNEISPAIKKTVETMRALNNEVQMLIRAITEGKLDIRANGESYSGSWKDLITGINGLVDAFINPINMTAEYIDRISKGDIPPKITDEYHGDFNEIKNNINSCIDVMEGLIAETDKLSLAVKEGKLDLRGKHNGFGGSWGNLIEEVNDLIDEFVSPINIMAEYMERIGKGEIPPVITDTYYGDFNEIKNNINSCIDGLGGLIEGRDILKRMSKNDYTGIVKNNYQGIYAEIAESTNGVSENVNNVIRILKNVSIGDFVDLETMREIGRKSDNDELMPAVIKMVVSIKALVEETTMLSDSAVEGSLEVRGNAAKFEGEYAKVIKGINDTLDAVITPIQEASSVLEEMARGNLQIKMLGNYKGNHAELKKSLNETIENLLEYVGEISDVLTEMADGNLNLTITGEYKGDFIEIKNSLNNIISTMSQVMGDINKAAEQVATGAKQVSDGSQALSQGSTEQASSIQQLTASIAEIASQTKKNAINANQANELATVAKENAIKGNNHMKEMISSMVDINESSANISMIIKVIDDIAFQTNILALNAAVEAARAGQYGKGFAVVAEEVRNLAARSADAAKESTDLIEGSISKVQVGTKIVNETASELNEIVTDIEKAADLVGNIASASNEQASGIVLVNKGIEQVSQVVQNNTATAEESAASSEELSSQAELLKEMIVKFRLLKGVVGIDEPKLLKGGETNKSSKILFGQDNYHNQISPKY